MHFSILFIASLVAPLAVAMDPILVVPAFADALYSGEGTTHYGNPKDGCLDDETPFQIQDIPGMICAPKCAFGQCPGDTPDGTTAAPTCALQTPDGTQFCALLCTPGSDGDGECGEATCQPIQTVGVCTWSDSVTDSA